jgi:hypothetical protein
MGRVMNRSVSVSLVALALASTCPIHAVAQGSAKEPAGLLVGEPPQYREAYLSQLMAPFRRAAGEDQILTQDDIEGASEIVEAQGRSGLLTMFFAADLDGDFAVTITEWQKVMAAQPYDVGSGRFDKWDTDRDGVATLKEAYAAANASVSLRAPPLDPMLALSTFMALDAARDGALTASELEQAGRETFSRYDADNDGVLTPAERKRFAEEQRKHRQGQYQNVAAASCGLPKAVPEEKVFFVSGYEAAALSTVTTAGQDRETHTAEIFIEPGNERLFIIATSYTPMIWRVTGAVERISHFVTGAGGRAGVVGLDSDRVTFASLATCIPAWTSAEKITDGRINAINKAIGSASSGIFSAYTLAKVTLPSAASLQPNIQPRRTKPIVEFAWGPLQPTQNAAIKALKQFSPGGVITIDALSVLSSVRAEDYDVLPQEAGLAQLIQEDKIELDPRLGYVIKQAIPRFPAGLSGAHAVRFVLQHGVPMPAGKPGHSKVLTMEEAESQAKRMGQHKPRLTKERIDRSAP